MFVTLAKQSGVNEFGVKAVKSNLGFKKISNAEAKEILTLIRRLEFEFHRSLFYLRRPDPVKLRAGGVFQFLLP